MHVWEASVSASFFCEHAGQGRAWRGRDAWCHHSTYSSAGNYGSQGKYIANRNRASHFWKALPRARNCDGSLHGDQDVPFLHGHAITAAAHHG